MTNREWLNSLTDDELAETMQIECNLCFAWGGEGSCYRGGEHCVKATKEWLKEEYEPRKREFTEIQLYEAFNIKFHDRRAIGFDDIKKAIRELFL